MTRRRRRRMNRSSPSQAPDVTRLLAAYVVHARTEDLPAPVRAEACRTLRQLGRVRRRRRAARDARHRRPRAAAVLRSAAGQPARTPRADGRAARGADERHQLARPRLRRHAPEDRHPSGRARWRPAILALAETRPVSGREFLHALVLGAEVECRIGNAVYPAHYDRGWHITGTTGVFGAAAAAGRLLGLVGAADALGARPRRDAAGRPARDVRHDDQELSSRAGRAERPDGGAAGEGRLHQQRGRARGAHRLGARAQHRRATTRRSRAASATATRSC